jgi:hypothetical protein
MKRAYRLRWRQLVPRLLADFEVVQAAFALSFLPRFDLVVNLLAAKARRENRVIVCDGEEGRPFLHNLGDSRLNGTLAEVVEKSAPRFPAARGEYVENTGQRNYRVLFDKIHRRLGFQASRSVEAGIEQMKRVVEDETAFDHASPLYHNQRYLQQLGAIHKEGLDARVMAAFGDLPRARALASVLNDNLS